MRRAFSHFRLASLLTLGLTLLGCAAGDERLPTTKVAGRVTLEGKPLSAGSVTFFPVGNGKHATGAIGQSGEFSLSTYAPNDGAVVGQHKVVVQVSRVGPDGQEIAGAADIPVAYASAETTPLTVEISESSDDVTVDLKKKP